MRRRCENGQMTLVELSPGDVVASADALVRLQRAAYAVEAALIRDERIPGLCETEAELVARGLDWVVDLDEGRIVGALGYMVANEAVGDPTVDIDRLIVDPAHHRRGIGRRLVSAVMGLAPVSTVSTGRDNLPARHLYEGLGYRHRGDREVLPGLSVSDYILG